MAPKASLLLLAPALLTLLALPCALGVSNIVTEWSVALRRSLLTYTIRHQIGLRYYGILHGLQYQVLNAKSRDATLRRTLNDTILVATVSHFTLSTYFPDQQSQIYDGILAAQVGTSTNITAEYAFARLHALWILRARLDDFSNRWYNFLPAAAGAPAGQYQFTPGQVFAQYPQLGDTTPFAYKWTTQDLSAYTPPSVNSQQFLDETNEVYLVGGRTAASTLATDATKNTSDFWADGNGAHNNWNSIAIQAIPDGTSVYNTARFLTFLNWAAYDAQIATYKIKYTTLFWRPVTAIRQGFGSFTADPTWLPYLNTPAHPDYPSGHSTTAGAFGKGLADILKTDTISVTVDSGARSRGNALEPRSYTSIKAIVDQISLSRIYGGVHYKAAVLAAEAIGAETANQLKARFGIK